MSQWTADFTNDPNNDYELIIELLYNGQDVGVIKHGKKGLELVLFPQDISFSVPFDWLLGLMNEANKKLI